MMLAPLVEGSGFSAVTVSVESTIVWAVSDIKAYSGMAFLSGGNKQQARNPDASLFWLADLAAFPNRPPN